MRRVDIKDPAPRLALAVAPGSTLVTAGSGGAGGGGGGLGGLGLEGLLKKHIIFFPFEPHILDVTYL